VVALNGNLLDFYKKHCGIFTDDFLSEGEIPW